MIIIDVILYKKIFENRNVGKNKGPKMRSAKRPESESVHEFRTQ